MAKHKSGGSIAGGKGSGTASVDDDEFVPYATPRDEESLRLPTELRKLRADIGPTILNGGNALGSKGYTFLEDSQSSDFTVVEEPKAAKKTQVMNKPPEGIVNQVMQVASRTNSLGRAKWETDTVQTKDKKGHEVGVEILRLHLKHGEKWTYKDEKGKKHHVNSEQILKRLAEVINASGTLKTVKSKVNNSTSQTEDVVFSDRINGGTDSIVIRAIKSSDGKHDVLCGKLFAELKKKMEDQHIPEVNESDIAVKAKPYNKKWAELHPKDSPKGQGPSR